MARRRCIGALVWGVVVEKLQLVQGGEAEAQPLRVEMWDPICFGAWRDETSRYSVRVTR